MFIARSFQRLLLCVLGLLVLLAGGSPAATAQGLRPAEQKLWSTYQEGQFDAVIEDGLRLLEQRDDEESVGIHHMLGRVFVATDRHERAISHLTQSLSPDASASIRAWSLNFLGKAHYQRGNVAAADSAFRASRDLRASENSTRSSARWRRVLGFDEMYRKWTRIETDPFILFVSPNVAVSADQLRTRYQSAYKNIARFFGEELDRAVRIFVWASRQEGKRHGVDVGFANPEYAVIHAEVSQTPGHELAHIFENRVLSPAHQTGLISEGMAVYLDQTDRDRLRVARQAVREASSSVAMDEWWQKPPKAWAQIPAELRYPVAGAFVAHLAERGSQEQLFQLLRDQRWERAREIYGPETLTAWIDAFESSLSGEAQ